MDQLTSNINSVNVTEEELDALDEVSSTNTRYPYCMVERQGSNRIPKPEEQ